VNLESDRSLPKHARLKLIGEKWNTGKRRESFLELCKVGAHGRLKFSVNAHTGKVTYIAESYGDYATDYMVPFDPYKLNCVEVFQRALTHSNIGLERFTGNLTAILQFQFPQMGKPSSMGKFTREGQFPYLGKPHRVFLVDAEHGPIYIDGNGHANTLVDDVLSWFRKYRSKHVALLNAHRRRRRR
jgi:hypothetical protein